MHVVYVLPKTDYFLKGRRGRVMHALGVVHGLIENGLKVTVISGSGGREYLSRIHGVEVVEVPRIEAGFARNWRWTAQVISEVERVLSSCSANVLLIRYAVSNAILFSSLLERHSSLLRCFEVNSLAFHQYSDLPTPIRNVIKLAERISFRNADFIYVVSTKLREDLASLSGGRRIAVVPNGAFKRTSVYDRRTRLDDWLGPLQFVYLGVFQSYYEFDVVIKAFLTVRQEGVAAELHFFGDGPQSAVIEDTAAKAKDIVLHGRYDLEDVLSSDFFGLNTVLLLPNRGKGMSEIGSPIKLYEYMSFGLPILASSVAQATQVLGDGTTAVFYEPGDISSCSDAMRRLALDVTLRQQLARNVLEDFLKSHTWEARMLVLKRELERSYRESKSE